MEIVYYSKASDFLSQVEDQLKTDEAKYGLINGLARKLVNNPHAYGDYDPWFCIITAGKRVCAVAMRTPPYKVLLAHFAGDPVKIAEELVDSISEFSPSIPGVNGELKIADPFAKLWCAKHKINIVGKMAERVYRLTRVNDIRLSEGRLRLATAKEKELLKKWAHSFHEDVYASSNSNTPEDSVTPKIEGKDLYLWEDGVPVSMAAKSRPTENGISIGYVYTPPEIRRKGYATSCVATLCQELLDSGYKFCMLYTDLANPTSNSIYKKIGFKEVCDSVEYYFSSG